MGSSLEFFYRLQDEDCLLLLGLPRVARMAHKDLFKRQPARLGDIRYVTRSSSREERLVVQRVQGESVFRDCPGLHIILTLIFPDAFLMGIHYS